MNTKQLSINNGWRTINTLLPVLCSLLLVLSCENPATPKGNLSPIPAGKGSFSLKFADTARTILPDTPGLNDFAVYNLNFTPTNGGSAENIDRTNETLATDPVFLDPGTYNFVVNAYKDNEKKQLIARGTLNGIIISIEENTSATVTLEVLLSGTGTFRWEITFPDNVTANMTIIPGNTGGTNQEIIPLTPPNASGSRTLNSGSYNLTFNMENSEGKSVVWNELLYVYQNLESDFVFSFTDVYFSGSVYTVTYNYNDDITNNQTQSVLHGAALTRPSNPARIGYAFGGWYTDNGTFANLWDFANPVIESFALYAGWRDGTEAEPIPLTANTWVDGSITSSVGDSGVWYSFNVVSGTTYYVWWNDSKDGNSTKTLDVAVSAVYSGGTSIFTNIDSGWTSSQSFTASASGTVHIKVAPFTSGSTGTFAVAYSTGSTRPAIYALNFDANGGSGTVPNITVQAGSSTTLPNGSGLTRSGYTFTGWNTNTSGTGTNYSAGSSFTPTGNTTLYARWLAGTEAVPILLTENVWVDGSITSTASDSAVWYSINTIAIAGSTYWVYWNDSKNGNSTKTLDVKVSGPGMDFFTDIDSGWTSPQGFSYSNGSGSTQTVKIKVTPYTSGSTGTFAIAYSTGSSSSRPTPPYTVSFDTNGGSGTIPSETVTAGSNITLPGGSGLTRSGYTFNGWNTNASGTGTNYSAGSSFRPTDNTILYARWLDGSEANPISLTANIWTDGSITSTASTSAVWYSFNVTNGSRYYVWWNDSKDGNSTKTLDVAVNAVYSVGTSVFTSVDSGWSSPQSFTANRSGTVHIRVTPSSSSSTGTFAIAYSTSSTRPISYAVTFNANSGSGTIPSETVIIGSGITLPSGSGLTRNGYTFDGWNTNASGTGITYSAGSSFTPTSNTVLYAKWIVFYTVTFNANNGSGTVPSPITVQAGFSITLPSGSVLSRSGYAFDGWNTNTSGSGTNYSAGSSFTPTGNTTLYARWATTYTVTFDRNGGSGTTPGSQTVTPGSSITLPSGSGLSRSNYTFGGWNTNTSGSGTNYAADSSYTPTSTITLYARWDIPLTANTWTDGSITSSASAVCYSFNVVNGTTYYVWWNDSKQGNSTKTLDVKVSGIYSSGTSIFTNIDSGWTSSRSFTADRNSTVHITVTPYSSGTGTFAIGYNTTSGTRPPYTVSFNANGGSGTVPNDETVSAGSSITLPSGSSLSRNGFTFGGWNTNDSITGTNYNAGASYTPTGNITLYAKWDPDTTPIPLTANVWTDGSITSSASGSGVWYSFNVTSGTTYYVWWNDSKNGNNTKSLDVAVSAVYSGGSSAFVSTDSAWMTSPRSFTANRGGTVYVRVTPYSNGNIGTFAVVYSTSNTFIPPPVNITITNTSEWNQALATVQSNGNGTTAAPLSYTFNISGNFTVPGLASATQTTGFGAVTNIVVTLAGNGILSLSDTGTVVYIRSDQRLVIDSANVTLRGIAGNSYGVLTVQDGGNLELKNGIISGNSSSSYGGGVYVTGNGSSFTMSGGEISGNTSDSGGGGVYVTGSGSSFTMSGGRISGNRTTSIGSYGSGVYINSGSFTMSGGEISGNSSSSYGGGVYVTGSGSSFTMSSGEISGNTSDSGGGGVYISNGNFNITDGKISNNTATSSHAGGVYFGSSGTFTMSGGEISGNTASSYSGGVYVGGGNFNMSGTAKINDNTNTNTSSSYGYAGGVYFGSSGTFTMSGGQITDNHNSSTSANASGGVYIYNGTFTMNGGSVTGNTNAYNTSSSADVFIASTFNLSGGSSIGSLTLHATSTSTQYPITLNGAFTGSIVELNLSGSNSTITTVIDYWNGKPVVRGSGYTLTSADVAKLNNVLGEFRYSSGTTRRSIKLVTPAYIINESQSGLGNLRAN